MIVSAFSDGKLPFEVLCLGVYGYDQLITNIKLL